ncbi:hypothetical protein SAMN04488072_10919 [Lentibacillus halodurans]|uniref:Peptidyl-prolyl cis-trans isomerase n=1 Tax=Lentibacillus halodurans TaxID=237679 RepID=A0A1I0Z248_9BACI|nr:hypothetical protein [Lentibacillus halodurans]SFB18353.1 hypothetical protein SAMN04488072_10919 [Lentibacillus halodurans]
MIVPITGNVTYTITLDPTVWIFDDRKILLDDAFTGIHQNQDEEDELEKASERWNQAVYQQKINPPVNKSISRMEGQKFLENSYVMPIAEFLNHAKVNEDANRVILKTASGEENIPLEALEESFLLFALDGKPLKEDGPVHLLYRDGSNRENPIKGIQKIVVQ